MSEDIKLSESLSFRDGFLYCENICIKNLQQELVHNLVESGSSPFFVYSKSQLQKNVAEYQRALEDNDPPIKAQLGYALKANYNLHLVRLIQQMDCCAIAVSGNELRLALEAGFPADKIILNGNGKYKWELELAARSGCLVNIDSIFDFHHVRAAAKSVSKIIKCLIRINPDIDPKVHPFLATGLSKSKFGVDDSQMQNLLDSVLNEESLELVGLHCHLGSTIGTTEVFRECLDVMLQLVERVKKSGVTTLKYINLGGGLNIDYRKHEKRTAVKQRGINLVAQPEKSTKNGKSSAATEQSASKAVGDSPELVKTNDDSKSVEQSSTNLAQLSVESAKKSPPLPNDLAKCIDAKKLSDLGITLVLEPGRSIIGSAGLLVTKVIGCKSAGDRNYIVVDGAMTEVIRPSLYGAYHHIELTEPVLARGVNYNSGKQSSELTVTGKDDNSNLEQPERKIFDIVGPVCECADFLGKDRLLDVPHEGCGLAVLDVGAYCSSMSSNYNMRARPAEVLVDEDRWTIIREPETFEDLVRPFSLGAILNSFKD